jgi:hypothetical protein
MLRVVCRTLLCRIGREYTGISAESAMTAGCGIATFDPKQPHRRNQ